MNLVIVKCALCGKEFSRSVGRFNEAKKSGWKQYCSRECIMQPKIKRIVLKCENCNKKIERSFHQLSLHNYCSQSCAAIANNKKHHKRIAKVRTCLICKKQFQARRKYCSRKCRLKVLRSYTRHELIAIIKQAHKQFNRIPTKREIFSITNMCIRLFGSWNKAIIAAGLEPNRSHNQRMYKCARAKALDGHICDSISELIIDNWLTENNITHRRNVAYPETNHKADWGINLKEEIIFVEYFGLAQDSPRYERTIKEKKEMCRQYGIVLIEIYPQDLYYKGHIYKEKLKNKFKIIICQAGGTCTLDLHSPSVAP